MAYSAGSATDIHDLIDKLLTFATANGWTQDEYVDAAAGYCTLHRDSCYVSFRWDDTTANALGVYQSTGWTASVFPHQQTGDSGNGDTSAPIDTERRVNFESTGPFTQYYFFAHTSPYYIHIAVEVDAGRYRHFGFGHLNKIGTWTGGEYVYGHLWSQTSTQTHLPTSQSHSFLLDAADSSQNESATMRVQGMPGQDPSSVWMILGNMSSAGNDSDGNPRIYGSGSSRGGFWMQNLSWLPMSRVNAYKPFIPIDVWWRDATPAPDTWIMLGNMPEVAIVNMRYFNPADVISVGGNDWVVFPWVRKQILRIDNIEETWNAGVAYRKRV